MLRALRLKVGNWEAGPGTLEFRLTEQRLRLAILVIALIQGLLFVVLVPPWQHYDEPTHFEYAWLIAHLQRRPLSGDEDTTMRREVQASMVNHGFFGPHPSLLERDAGQIWIGYSELGHPPGYYGLAALPIALLPHLDVTSQLYMARMVSLLLFVGTVALAWGFTAEIVPVRSPLRWAVPLFIALLPTFADVMTSVNSDVGAVFVSSLFLWGAVRLIMRGFTLLNLLWVLGAAVLGIFTKNTAMYGLILAPVAMLFALWVRARWRLRSLVVILAAVSATMLLALFGWGDAKRWYRADTQNTQPTPTRLAHAEAPVGNHVFMVEAGGSNPARRLLYPLRDSDVTAVAGTTITLGGWVWADRNTQLAPIELDVATRDSGSFQRFSQTATISTKPSFITQTLVLPPDARRVQVALLAADSSATPIRLYFDGIVLIPGSFDTAQPRFTDSNARQLIWSGRELDNLIEEASAEDAWLRPRAWLDDTIKSVIRHRPSEAILSFLDVERTGQTLLGWSAPLAVDGLVERFAWSQVRLENPVWTWMLRSSVVLALCGTVWWIVRDTWHLPPRVRAALVFLALAVVIVWSVTVLRPLPMLGPVVNAPVTRYAFPAILPTALALTGGWLAPWASRRNIAAAWVVIALMILEAVSIASIYSSFGPR